MEKNIDRWSKSVHRLLVDQPAMIAVCAGSQLEVASSRCDIDHAGAEQRAMNSLFDSRRRDPVQALGEAFDVSGGNMLNNQRCRAICGKLRDHFRKRLDAAG